MARDFRISGPRPRQTKPAWTGDARATLPVVRPLGWFARTEHRKSVAGTVSRATRLVNGKRVGEAIKEPEFFNALMKIWPGKSPADANLKQRSSARSRAAPAASLEAGMKRKTAAQPLGPRRRLDRRKRSGRSPGRPELRLLAGAFALRDRAGLHRGSGLGLALRARAAASSLVIFLWAPPWRCWLHPSERRRPSPRRGFGLALGARRSRALPG